MDPMTIAGAAAGAGQLLGGIGGLFGGGGAKYKDLKKPYTVYADQFGRVLDKQVAAYREQGFHPLLATGAAIGAPSVSTTVGDSGNRLSSMADIGQGIGRAASAVATKEQRLQQEALSSLALERASLENDLLRAQITKIHAPRNPPAPGSSYSMPGQPASGVEIVPREITSNTGAYEVGVGPSHKLVDFADGRKVRVASDDLQQSIEDGPANWYYQGTRTIPDMLDADIPGFKHALNALLAKAFHPRRRVFYREERR